MYPRKYTRDNLQFDEDTGQYSIDAATGLAFLLSQLTYIESKMYEKLYKAITYNLIIPISSEAGEWAESVTYFFMTGAAVAKFVGTKSLNVPIAEIGTDKITVPVCNYKPPCMRVLALRP